MMRSLRFWLGAVVALLVTSNLFYMWWQNRGLITIHADNQPFAKIQQSIASQGGITLASNVDAATMITLHFDKIPLTDALDRLVGTVDGRWSLTYLYSPDKTKLKAAIAAFKAGRLPEDWRSFRLPVPDFMEEDGPPPDPRALTCSPTTPEEKTLHNYLNAFASSADATAATPQDWNPAMTATLKEDVTPTVAYSIAKGSKSEFEEAFFVSVRQPRPEGENFGQRREGDDNSGQQRGGPRPQGGRPQFDETAMVKRVENRIASLPPEKRAEAKKDFEDQRKFWEELRALPEDQRRAKMEERMEDPAVQAKMDSRENYRDSRRSPQKRLERFQRNLDRKKQIQNSQTQ